MEKRQVILLIADGARADLLYKLISGGKLPALADLVAQYGYRKITSVFPSTSGPAYIPFLSGFHPIQMGIPGIRWFDREAANQNWIAKKAFRSYVSANNSINKDIYQSKKLLFEMFPSGCYGSKVSRGISRNWQYKLIDDLRYANAYVTNDFFTFDRHVENETVKAIEDKIGFVFSVFHAIDGLGHRYGAFSSKTIQAYKSVDNSIGRILKVIKGKPNTLLMVSSDHGFSDVKTHFDLGNYFKKNNLSIAKFPLGYINLRKKQIVFATSGNSMSQVYSRGQDGRWDSKFTTKAIDTLLKLPNEDGIDLVGIKTGPNQIILASHFGRSILKVHADEFRGELEQSAHSTQLLENYTDLISQTILFFSKDRSGSAFVTSSNEVDFVNVEIKEHFGTHGSLRPEHMVVPFVSNDSRITRGVNKTADCFNVTRTFLTKLTS